MAIDQTAIGNATMEVMEAVEKAHGPNAELKAVLVAVAAGVDDDATVHFRFSSHDPERPTTARQIASAVLDEDL